MVETVFMEGKTNINIVQKKIIVTNFIIIYFTAQDGRIKRSIDQKESWNGAYAGKDIGSEENEGPIAADSSAGIFLKWKFVCLASWRLGKRKLFFIYTNFLVDPIFLIYSTALYWIMTLFSSSKCIHMPFVVFSSNRVEFE